MTDAELKALVASLAESQKETDRQLRETDARLQKSLESLRASQAETDRQLRETDARLQKNLESLSAKLAETDARLEKKLQLLSASLVETDGRLERKLDRLSAELLLTDKRLDEKLDRLSAELSLTDRRLERKLDRLSDIVGGISNNNGYFAEDLFIAALEKRPQLGAIQFDSLHSHYKGASRKGFEYEYDILLQNGDYIGLVEVKYRLHPEAVRKFATEALPRFKEIFPQFSDKKLVGAVASTSIPVEAIEEARKYGLAVMAQEGPEIRMLSEDLREY